MIITRTPMRISLGGGGTDLPSYYRDHGGFVISAAIDKYIYIAINHTFTSGYFIKYSSIERVESIDAIDHPIVREALRMHSLDPRVEIVSVADIPSGTGLGSSGSFAVGLLRALYAYQRVHVTPANLADAACAIEIDKLGRAVGRQDQYIAAFGGLTCLEIDPGGQIRVSPLMLSNSTLHDLEEHLLMFFTGYSRDAEKVLEEQRSKSESGEGAMIENLHYVKSLGYQSKEALELGNTARFAELMNEHWDFKKSRSQSMSNPDIDHWHQVAMDSGALGGKLVGAGAGGFLLFYASEQDRLRRTMLAEGLEEVRFGFDFDGSIVLVRD